MTFFTQFVNASSNVLNVETGTSLVDGQRIVTIGFAQVGQDFCFSGHNNSKFSNNKNKPHFK
jgi:hypothetical protein